MISSKVSDFAIGKYTFEVGGAKKSHKQIKDVQEPMSSVTIWNMPMEIYYLCGALDSSIETLLSSII